MDRSDTAASREIYNATSAKIARRLIPFLIFCYFLSYVDRVNVGFAALTMNKDLGFGPEIFGMGAGIFFIGYFIFGIPSNLLLRKYGARICVGQIMILWGLVSAAMALVKGETSFFAMRFILGASEAGFFPGIILYLTFWFTARERARWTGMFMLSLPLSAVIGGPLSGTILDLMNGWHDLAGWQWLFIIEGFPSVLAGIVVLFYLTNRPEEALWLTVEDRTMVCEHLAADDKSRTGSKKMSFRP